MPSLLDANKQMQIELKEINCIGIYVCMCVSS